MDKYPPPRAILRLPRRHSEDLICVQYACLFCCLDRDGCRGSGGDDQGRTTGPEENRQGPGGKSLETVPIPPLCLVTGWPPVYWNAVKL